MAEIDDVDRRLLFFVDDNIAANRAALVELCHALIRGRSRGSARPASTWPAIRSCCGCWTARVAGAT